MSIKCLAIALLFSSALLSQDKPRHIDFTQPIIGLDGKPMINGDPKAPIPLTLGEVTVAALFSPTDEDRHKADAEKGPWALKIYDLGMRIYKHSDVVLTAEDIALLKARVAGLFGVGYTAPVIAQALKMLDPATEKPK